MAFVVKRCALIVEGKQHDELHPALHQFDHAAAHRLAVAAFFEISDEDERCLFRTGDALLAESEGTIDVRATAKLHAEKQVNRILHIVRQIHHRCIEDDETCAQAGQGRQHRSENTGIDDRSAH